ncbi:MAG: hypothetical protein IT258_03645, partial [Saprospiraceae bacterium]|nr:hypothetical protein [Saprospiraceae bacterium]
MNKLNSSSEHPICSFTNLFLHFILWVSMIVPNSESIAQNSFDNTYTDGQGISIREGTNFSLITKSGDVMTRLLVNKTTGDLISSQALGDASKGAFETSDGKFLKWFPTSTSLQVANKIQLELLSPTGTVLWTGLFGNLPQGYSFQWYVAIPSADGNFVVGGIASSDAYELFDDQTVLVKVNGSTGQLIWEQNIPHATVRSLRPVPGSNDFVVLGEMHTTTGNVPGNLFIKKFNGNGQVQLDYANVTNDIRLIRPLANGDLLYISNPSLYSFKLQKMNSSGSVVMTTQEIALPPNENELLDLIATNDGGSLLALNTHPWIGGGHPPPPSVSSVIFKFNSTGEQVWATEYIKTCNVTVSSPAGVSVYGIERRYFTSVIATTDGGIAALGTLGPCDDPDRVALVKTDANGNLTTSPQGQIDLSLTAQQLTASPAQWSNYPVKLTINNAGPQTATGVKVKFAKPTGVVYVGGNEFTASQGSFNPNGDEVWTVGSIPANSSATLTVNYFLLNTSAPVAYAQVTAANETDSDSQPNNGTPPTPVQDDEASTSSGGGQLPDFKVISFRAQAPNLIGNYYDMVPYYQLPAGTVIDGWELISELILPQPLVDVSVTIKAYLSADQILDASDVLINDFQPYSLSPYYQSLGYSSFGFGYATIPINTVPGNYYLIAKYDGDNVVAESDETNNTSFLPLIITSSSNQVKIDLNLSMQQVESNPVQGSNYTIKLIVKNEAGGIASDIKIKFPKPTGVAYVAGNEFTTSLGDFNTNDEIWTLDFLPKNSSGTLTVNYFLQNPTAPVAYAQVISALQTDVDSAPNNGTPPTPNEDDEASSNNTCYVSATASNIQCDNNGTPSVPSDDTFSFDITATKSGSCGSTFTVTNIGNGLQYGISYHSPSFFIGAGGSSSYIVRDDVN